MGEMKNNTENDKPQVKSNVNVKFTLKIHLWNPFEDLGAPIVAVQSLFAIISFDFFFQPIFESLGLSHAKLLSVLVPFSIFTLSPINIAFAESYNVKKKVYSGINLGGGVIPMVLSIYFMLSVAKAWLVQELVVFAITLYVSYYSATVESEGIAITVPTVVFASTLSTLLLIRNPVVAPMVAYSSSVLGVAIGGDILHTRKIIGCADGSIGGLGVVDAISLAGLYSLAITYFVLDIVGPAISHFTHFISNVVRQFSMTKI